MLDSTKPVKTLCTYPMSLFYTYQEDVPPNTRVSTTEDCEKCMEGTCDNCCWDTPYCLITE